jgi:hypothetical protein
VVRKFWASVLIVILALLRRDVAPFICCVPWVFRLSFVSFVSLVSFSSISAETIDRVLAVVAGQIITLSDVTAARDLQLESAGSAPDPIRALLSKLIDRELMLAEVERYTPGEPSAEAVAAELAAIRARFPSSDAFEAALARSGIDERHVRETIRQNLRIRTYVDQRFSPSDERRPALIAEWVAGLRRRADVVDLYLNR